MDARHDKLIDDLVADLKPVRRAGRIGMSVAAWLALAAASSLLLTQATGPWRPGAFHDLVAHPWFAAECALAALAVLALAVAALRSAIPGGRDAQRRLWWALLFPCAWTLSCVAGLWHPARPSSTLGDRGVCFLEVMAFCLPTLVLMLRLARRQYPQWPRATGLLAGAAAAALPAALMQFACMYEPRHILLFHIGPILPMALLGAWLGPWLLKRRGMPPRGPEGPAR